MNNTKLYADLHIHSIYSDGTHTIKDIIELSKKINLSAISITDHDTIDGIEPAMEYIKKSNIDIELIPGTELSTKYKHLDMHILAYSFDYKNKEFLNILQFYKDKRKSRAEQIIAKLNQLGYELEFEKVKDMANGGSIGRPHIARALVESGMAPNITYVFDNLIGYHKPAYIPKELMTPQYAIDIIHKAGGIAVLAHSGNYLTEAMLKELLSYGLDGIEVYHPNHDDQTTFKLLQIAKKYALFITGGSDSHGLAKNDTYIGYIKLPYVYYEKLKQHNLKATQ